MKAQQARKTAYERGIENILQVTEAGDFCEVIGTIGGDVLRLRIYANGDIYEK